MPDSLRNFEAEGLWWLPDYEDQKVAGILSYSPDSGSELRLIGTLSTARGSHDVIYERIHGLANGQQYHLEDCYQKSYKGSLFSPGGETEAIHVQHVFRGVHYTGPDEPSADRVTANLRYLTQWVGHQGITIQHYSFQEQEMGKPFASLQASKQKDHVTKLSDGASFKIQHRISSTPHTGTERALRESYECSFEFPKLTSTSIIIECVSDVQDLVSIATGRVAEYDEFTLWHPDAVLDPSTSSRRTPINFFTEWIPRDTSKKPGNVNQSNMFFTFDDLGEIEGVRSWLETAGRHRSTLGRVMASRYRKGLFVEDRLFHRATAIEAFARTRIGYKGVKLPGALKHCHELAGAPFSALTGDPEAWAVVVKSNRDDIGHHLDKRPDQGGSAQYFLAESLYWLFVLCMLREAGAPEVVFDRINNHPELAWLGPKVQAVVQAG
ncbi:ApeA N-terminal domain 1-containing protein [Streptomyces sp. NPDC004270]